MRFSKLVVMAALVGAMTMAVAPYAQAQDNQFNTAFGYQFLTAKSSNDSEQTKFPAGFFVNVAGQITPTMKELNWVGDLTWGRHSEDGGSVKVTTVGGGVRYSFLQNMMYTPFVEVIGGVAHVGFSEGGQSDSENDGFIGVDGGIDYPIKNGWAFRAAVGYARIFASDEGINAIRVHVGVSTKLPMKK